MASVVGMRPTNNDVERVRIRIGLYLYISGLRSGLNLMLEEGGWTMFTEVRAATLYKYYDHTMLRLTGLGLLAHCIRIYACLFSSVCGLLHWLSLRYYIRQHRILFSVTVHLRTSE